MGPKAIDEVNFARVLSSANSLDNEQGIGETPVLTIKLKTKIDLYVLGPLVILDFIRFLDR